MKAIALTVLFLSVLLSSGCQSQKNELSYHQAIERDAYTGVALYLEHKVVSSCLLFKFKNYGIHLKESEENIDLNTVWSLGALKQFYKITEEIPPADLAQYLDEIIEDSADTKKLKTQINNKIEYYQKENKAG